MEDLVENSVYLGVPIDRPVDFFDKIRIFFVSTFEHVVTICIFREELEISFVGRSWDCSSSTRLL